MDKYLALPLARPQYGFVYAVKRVGADHAIAHAATREIALLLAKALNDRDIAIAEGWNATGKALRGA